MGRLLLVHPAQKTVGGSLMTPRWAPVLMAATPHDLVDDIIFIDETLDDFDPVRLNVRQGDIVGISNTSLNCQQGYHVLRQSKARGATVVLGGIHTTLYPDEALEQGADAVVTGDADVIWERVLRDIKHGTLQRRYDGGKVEGELMCQGDWSRVQLDRYLVPTVQTMKGCPKACSFCTVHITDGQKMRMRLADKVIEEVLELRARGVRLIFLADDNADPVVQSHIDAAHDLNRKAELQRAYDDRLAFFEEYGRRVPPDVFAITQMTAEIAGDPVYLKSLHDNMRVCGALIGIEAIDEAGLRSIKKGWNPKEEELRKAIQTIQRAGIYVLASMIVGLPTATPEILADMRKFVIESGVALAQFPIYTVLPGSPDYKAMIEDLRNRNVADLLHEPPPKPRHPMQLLSDRYWLDAEPAFVLTKHPTLSADVIANEAHQSWATFYHPRRIIQRARAFGWPWKNGLVFSLISLAFYAQNSRSRHGIAADATRIGEAKWHERMFMALAIYFNRRYFRRPLPEHARK